MRGSEPSPAAIELPLESHLRVPLRQSWPNPEPRNRVPVYASLQSSITLTSWSKFRSIEYEPGTVTVRRPSTQACIRICEAIASG